MVRDIVYGNGQAITDMPIFIVVEWYNYIGPPFFVDSERQRKWISMSDSKFFSDDFRHNRTQYPLRLSYAMTINNIQGQKLDRVVVNLGKRERTLGLAFVALSRVRYIHIWLPYHAHTNGCTKSENRRVFCHER